MLKSYANYWVCASFHAWLIQFSDGRYFVLLLNV
jgi:hypothetical protein